MNSIEQYAENADLALAAYLELGTGAPDTDTLVDDGKCMAPAQAARFAENWRVMAQYDGKVPDIYEDESGQEQTYLRPTGLSATVFEEVGTGNRVLAIRGTENLPDFITDVIDVAILGTPEQG